MLPATDVALVLGACLVELEAAVHRVIHQPTYISVLRTGGHRHEAARDLEVLPKHLHRIDPRYCRGDRQAHGIPECVLDASDALGDRLSAAAETLHPDGRDSLAVKLRKHLGLEAPEVAVEAIERQLTGVERKTERQHTEVNGRVLMS